MTRTKIVVDTDILSMFAKAGAMPVLGAFLGQGRLVMTPAIYDEIAADDPTLLEPDEEGQP